MTPPIKGKLLAYGESIRPFTSILGMAGAYIGGIVAEAPFLSTPLLLAIIVVFLVGAGSMPFNDYFDRDVDAISHPKRPIPSKRLTPRETLYFALILFSLAAAISLFINLICFIIILATFGFLYSYEVLFKNQGFIGNIVVAFFSSMSFTFGGIAVGNLFASLLLSLITFFLFTGREVLKDVEDVKGDLLSRKTLPMKIGEYKAVLVASIFLLVAVFLSPLPYLLNQLGIWYLITIILVDALALYIIYQNLKDLRNTTRSVRLTRIAAAIGIIGIILGALL
ncbi:MAG: UbiA family prenyltransferase [Candidatus Thermoplasmatota archaeon]|jgi:geranylgeranylglycerol-phosphate geranylgeranyltransferase|nr:UbiA family prenyltransferase [Candidatus Thermoplasmatota archaeon]